MAGFIWVYIHTFLYTVSHWLALYEPRFTPSCTQCQYGWLYVGLHSHPVSASSVNSASYGLCSHLPIKSVHTSGFMWVYVHTSPHSLSIWLLLYGSMFTPPYTLCQYGCFYVGLHSCPVSVSRVSIQLAFCRRLAGCELTNYCRHHLGMPVSRNASWVHHGAAPRGGTRRRSGHVTWVSVPQLYLFTIWAFQVALVPQERLLV